MKSLFCFAVLFFVSTTFSFAQDSCASGKCLKAPVKAAVSVVGTTVGVASNVATGTVELVGNTLNRVGNVAVTTVGGVKTVVSAPVRRVTTATRNTARFTANVVRRPLARLFR